MKSGLMPHSESEAPVVVELPLVGGRARAPGAPPCHWGWERNLEAPTWNNPATQNTDLNHPTTRFHDDINTLK